MMPEQRALITGATGFLGRELSMQFAIAGFHTTGTSFSRRGTSSPHYTLTPLDLTDLSALGPVLDSVKPRIVIHSAASRFPDVVDKDPEGAQKLNVESSRALARECAKRGILIVVISTDYVFSGREDEKAERPYGASSTPGPTNLYGQTKLDSEQAVLSVTDEAASGFVLRVPVLYGKVEPESNHRESAVNVLLEQTRKAQQDEVIMDDWSIRYPTNTEDVGRVTAELATRLLGMNVEERRKVGGAKRIFAYTAEERMTKYEMCERLAGVLSTDVGKMKANKQGNDPKASVQRPYDCHLSTRELRELGVDVSHMSFDDWWRRHLGAFRK